MMEDSSVTETAEDSDTTRSASESSSVSLMDKLKAPIPSHLTRKRKVRTNPPPTGKRRSSARGHSDPKSVMPEQRVKEFPVEELTVSGGKLFCKACREELSVKVSVLKGHLQSEGGKQQLLAKEARERDIATLLQQHHKDNHLEGESLPIGQQVYCVKVLTAFLCAAIPLGKVDCFRQVLEENALRLTDHSHLANLVPFVHQEQHTRLKEEMRDKQVSVIFDGTTRLGEAMVVVLRFISKDWELQQRLVRLHMLAKSMTGEEIARVLISTLSVQYSIPSNCLLAARASVNGVAMKTLQIVYPMAVDIGCFSHTLNLVGERFKVPLLSEFINSWVSLFAHSPKARLYWKECTGIAVRSYSPTRWWSQWEVIKQAMELFGDILPFLTSSEEFATTIRRKLLAILNDTTKKALLHVEMAAVVDAGEPLVKATYRLDGDGPIALECYEIVSSVIEGVRVAHYPNVEAIVRKLSAGNHQVQQQLTGYAHAALKPGLDYLHRVFSDILKPTMGIFKVAKLFRPHKVVHMQPDADALNSLGILPFLSATTIAKLKEELPSYLAKAADISPELSPLTWWKMNATSLPTWSSTTQQVLLIQPSSAASERVFSLLKNSFGDQQLAALEDYVETSLILQYNKK